MAKKSITRNYIYNTAYQILTLILPLITTPYVSRVLGAENIGIYSFTISIATYFILFGTLGISMYAQREIAYVQDDLNKKSKIFWEIILLRFITMGISIIVFYFVYINGTEYQVYYKILVLELIAVTLDITWFFQGIEDFKKTVIRNIIVKIISIVSIFIFVKTQDDLVNYLLIYALSDVIANISLWLYLPKYIKKIKIHDLKITKHLKPTIGLFIPQIAIQVYTLLDKVMLGYIIEDKTEVGYYDQAQKIIKMLLTVVTSLGTVMLPRMANTFIKGDNKKLKEYMKKSFSFVFFLSIPMIFGIIVVSKDFVPIFFGEGYENVALVMNVISPILLIIGISNVIGTQYLLPTKRQKEFTISVVCGAIVNFVANMILIKNYGAVGASIATVIAEAIVTSTQIYFVRKDIDISYIFKKIKNYLIAGFIMFIVCYLIKFINLTGIVLILIQVLIGTIVYLAILILLKDEFLNYLLEKVKNIINKKKKLIKNIN